MIIWNKKIFIGIKIAPLTTEDVTNAKTCFWINGTVGNPVSLQSVIPDFSSFTVNINFFL